MSDEILTLEGFQVDTTCDYKDCGLPAERRAATVCCGKVWFFCAGHVEVNIDLAERYGVVCTYCSATHHYDPFINVKSIQ